VSIINPKVRKYMVATLHEKLNKIIMMMQALHLRSDVIRIIIALGGPTYKYAKVYDDQSERTIVNCFPLHFPLLVPLRVARDISENDFYAEKNKGCDRLTSSSCRRMPESPKYTARTIRVSQEKPKKRASGELF
jgi:hypothetical protein